MNKVPLARRIQAINALVEGNSIRSTKRMTGTHRDTIMRLLVEVGAGCDERMRGLSCQRLQVDEVWSFVAKKQRHLSTTDHPRRVGDVWTSARYRGRAARRLGVAAAARSASFARRLGRVDAGADSLRA